MGRSGSPARAACPRTCPRTLPTRRLPAHARFPRRSASARTKRRAWSRVAVGRVLKIRWGSHPRGSSSLPPGSHRSPRQTCVSASRARRGLPPCPLSTRSTDHVLTPFSGAARACASPTRRAGSQERRRARLGTNQDYSPLRMLGCSVVAACLRASRETASEQRSGTRSGTRASRKLARPAICALRRYGGLAGVMGRDRGAYPV